MKIALAGNPNSGKTSLFNRLTGLKQHTGNWPGKTIEKKEGSFSYKGMPLAITDLPGTYSLSAYSEEEIVTRDFIINNSPDIVLNIVDASNLERNLYLTIQLIELGANVMIALNMNKAATKHGLDIDEKKLSELLNIPVIKIEAIDDTGKKELLDAISDYKKKEPKKITYGEEIDAHLEEIEAKAKNRWLALKLIENDELVMKMFLDDKELIEKVKKVQNHLSKIYGEDVSTAITDARYGFISGLIAESVKKPKIDKVRKSDIIDRIVLNKYLGLPIFLVIMYLMFQATFTLAEPLIWLIETFFAFLSQHTSSFLLSISAPQWILSFSQNAIFGGLGAVLVFLPNIFLLFLLIALLEDSGYMARAAFLMDRIMHKIGLHGKSFIPMILGFGCNVPAIMATRTLENKRDRILTILINPCMSCSARLPVYILFAGAFFSAYQGLVIFSIYLLGIITAVILGKLLGKTILKGESPGLVMELPSYRIPTPASIFIHVWQRVKQFLVKAGTIIFVFVIVMWFLSNIPFGAAPQNSIIGIIGKAIAPIFSPIGFGFWEAAVALISGVFAKEIIVGTFGTLISLENLQSFFTPLSAYSFMIFTLLYIPCVPTLVAIKNELNWKWMLFAAIYLFATAWLVSFTFYQIGGLLI